MLHPTKWARYWALLWVFKTPSVLQPNNYVGWMLGLSWVFVPFFSSDPKYVQSDNNAIWVIRVLDSSLYKYQFSVIARSCAVLGS